jgi:hypothetical protein
MNRDASKDLLARHTGDREPPQWSYTLVRTQGGTVIAFSESESHPEEPPVLRLASLVDNRVVGEVWLYPEDLPSLVALLQEQLRYYQLRPGEERVEQLDLYKQPLEASRRRPERTVRQYYGDFP